MAARKFEPDAPFQGIRGAARLTGLSQGYIRGLCRSGQAPCIRVGAEYRINMPLLMRLLAGESVRNIKEGMKIE
jgi:excisionase family DNA binding protein